MKKILCFIVLIYSVGCFSQDSTQKLTPSKVYQDVKDGFQNLVEKLQGPAKHTYEVYVRQHVISGVGYVIIATLFLFFSLVFMVKAFKKGKWDSCGDPDNAWATGQIVFSITSAIAILIFSGIFWGDSFGEIVNPEYYAIQDIIKALK